MDTGQELIAVHPTGDREIVGAGAADWGGTVDTSGGPIRVRQDEDAPVTPFGQLVFFTGFLKTAGLWDTWVKGCVGEGMRG
jgi:hypothetical protein